MADTNENKVLDGENKTSDEKQPTPIVAVDITDTGGNGALGEQSQSAPPDKDQGEKAAVLEADAPPASEKTAAQETEKPDAAENDAPAKARRGRQTAPFNPVSCV